MFCANTGNNLHSNSIRSRDCQYVPNIAAVFISVLLDLQIKATYPILLTQDLRLFYSPTLLSLALWYDLQGSQPVDYRGPEAHYTNDFWHTKQILLEIYFCSRSDFNEVVTTNFCMWHNSIAVMTHAKFCSDVMISNGIAAKHQLY